MRTVYNRQVEADLRITNAVTESSFYGVACRLTLTVHAFEGMFGMRIEFDPIEDNKTFVGGASYNGMLRLAEGKGNNRRVIEQKITLPHLVCEGQGFVHMAESDEGMAREICQNLIRTHESLMEYCRRSAIDAFAGSVRERAVALVDQTYGYATEETARKLLAQINWRLMLDGVNAPEQIFNVVDFTMTNNAPAYYPLASEGYPNALELRNDFRSLWGQVVRYRQDIEDAKRIALQRAADIKAAQLLKLVCGDKLYQQFCEEGEITVKKNDWEFSIKPSAWIHCKDPEGRTARLCIHTVNLSCNPIDEIVISYLHIKNRFEEYMGKAIAHGRDEGFSLAQFKNPQFLDGGIYARRAI